MPCTLLALLYALWVIKADASSFARGWNITVECQENSALIILEPNELMQQIENSMKLVLSNEVMEKESALCETEIRDAEVINWLAPESCFSNSTLQKISLTTGNQTIYEMQFSCKKQPEVVLTVEQNGELLGINTSVQIGFDLNLIVSSQHSPFRIVNCWTEHHNHQASFLKNGVPTRDSRSEALCQLYDQVAEFNHGSTDYSGFNNRDTDYNRGFIKQKQKFWQIRLRLGWDTLPDSRQKAFQQLLRTKPQLQWEAVPELALDSKDLLPPVTIYPIMIRCSVSHLLLNGTSAIASFGPIGVFIPQFYFLENTLFSCCPVETTIAYAKLLQRAAQTSTLCSKVPTTTALLVSLTAFAVAVCCTMVAFHILQRCA